MWESWCSLTFSSVPAPISYFPALSQLVLTNDQWAVDKSNTAFIPEEPERHSPTISSCTGDYSGHIFQMARLKAGRSSGNLAINWPVRDTHCVRSNLCWVKWPRWWSWFITAAKLRKPSRLILLHELSSAPWPTPPHHTLCSKQLLVQWPEHTKLFHHGTLLLHMLFLSLRILFHTLSCPPPIPDTVIHPSKPSSDLITTRKCSSLS